ncbi:MAG: response regulator [Candidatus Komeilibacteria bacterium]|nr:response regulator [Candidatus Komeilibacteria bacterium]
MPAFKILFIEDDPDQIFLYTTKFKLEGYNFICAKNGIDGLKLAEKEKPNLILLDILLGNESGIDALKNLKTNKKTKDIPVIVFTNFTKKETVEQSLALGAVDYIIKSKVVPSEIVKKVAETLSKKRVK